MITAPPLFFCETIPAERCPLAQIIYFGENMTELNLAFAFFMLSMLPILILYLCTQRFIVAGIMSGAVKG